MASSSGCRPLAAQLVEAKVDVLVAVSSPGVVAAHQRIKFPESILLRADKVIE